MLGRLSSHIGPLNKIGHIKTSLGGDSFISTWDTTQAGSASDTVVLPLESGGVYSGTIDWGDGNTSSLSYANRTHVYASSGTYTITISGTIEGFQFNNGGDKEKIIDISNWGALNLTNGSVFYGCVNLDISATDAPTITTTTFNSMFRDCQSIVNADLNSWDVSAVTDMTYCFGRIGGGNDTCQINPNISDWDVSSVTNMSYMFSKNITFNRPLNSWDVSSVTNMFEMFSGADLFNQPLDNWNTSSVTNMGRMFGGYSLRTNTFNQDINAWDVSNVTNFVEMFSYGDFAGDIRDWNLTSASSTNLMFAYNNGTPNLSNWNTSTITDMEEMFRNSNFNGDISGWDTSSVTNMVRMFQVATQFNQDISSWDVSSVTNMISMFSGAGSFNQPIGSWTTTSLVRIDRMFRRLSNVVCVFNQDISNWDVTGITNASEFMRLSTSLSTTNYDPVLVAWEAQLQTAYPGGIGSPNVNIHFSNSQYTLGSAAETARTSLISTFGWSITDGGGI